MQNSLTSNSNQIPSALTHIALAHRSSVYLSTVVVCLAALFCCGLTCYAETEQINPTVKGVGTIVKKDPCCGSDKSTTNNKGQQEFTVREAGDYLITLYYLSSDASRTESQGGPVKGVKVGLGKNPSGAMVASAISDTKGNVKFKKLEPGSYFMVMTKTPTKEAPALPTRKVAPTAPKTEVIPATPVKP